MLQRCGARGHTHGTFSLQLPPLIIRCCWVSRCRCSCVCPSSASKDRLPLFKCQPSPSGGVSPASNLRLVQWTQCGDVFFTRSQNEDTLRTFVCKVDFRRSGDWGLCSYANRSESKTPRSWAWWPLAMSCLGLTALTPAHCTQWCLALGTLGPGNVLFFSNSSHLLEYHQAEMDREKLEFLL